MDILKKQPEAEELIKMADMGKIAVLDLLNKKSKTFRDLKIDVSSFTREQLAELLHQNPKTLFRPLLTDGHHLVVGFKPEEMKELLVTGGQ